MTLSIVIPVLNEEQNIKACIESAKRLNPIEIIVVDGGSTDRTVEIAKREGALVINSLRGRGIQMNRGASMAKGDILLFLHADSIISEVKIANYLMDGYIGGFFRLKFDNNSLPIKLVELFANLRARLFSLPYGDQAIFIRRDVFESIGRFREYPFLEDIEMVLRLRRYGRGHPKKFWNFLGTPMLRYIPSPVVVSSRRLKKGYPLSEIIVSLRNVIIALFFIFGVSPQKLHHFYR